MTQHVPAGPTDTRAVNLDDAVTGEALLAMDRPAWAWEFLRRNPSFRGHLRTAPPSRRETRSNVTTIDASMCAPEVRNFGICFR